jgi:hypothetical protein
MLFYLTSAPTTPAVTLHHAFGGPNHDDSVHVDVPTTTPTPQSSSTTCCGPRVLIVRDILGGLARYIVINIVARQKCRR